MGSDNLEGHSAVIPRRTTFLITSTWFYLEIRPCASLDFRFTLLFQLPIDQKVVK